MGPYRWITRDHLGVSADPGLDAAWQTLLAAAAGDAGRAARGGLALDAETGWRWTDAAPGDAAGAELSALYLPFIQPLHDASAVRVFGHLGQSLDGCVATDSGDACFVTGEANIVHLHRMRALADAVIVGAGTVASDDPLLTTRLVPGPNAVRVVIDPDARLPGRHRLFQDRDYPTLHCCRAASKARPSLPGTERIDLPDQPPDSGLRGLDLHALCARLSERGLRRLFVEGGGVTVTRFLRSGLLNRLQVAVAPVLIGRGRPGVSLPGVEHLSEALRPASRIFRMGSDILYDLDLTEGRQPADTRDQTLAQVR